MPHARPRLLATSDLHVNRQDNEDLVRELAPTHPGDWLIVAGDVADTVVDTLWALEILAGRFGRVLWAPGNHELWSPPKDAVGLGGVALYDHLVDGARALGVWTPEDPWPVWDGDGGPAQVVPMFLLYDYSFRPHGEATAAEALAAAREAGVVATDEYLMSCAPHEDAAAWCADRVARTRDRLERRDPGRVPTVLVNHWPLTRHPTRILRYPEFALWCGTVATADWHVRYDATAVVYGHLHLPRTTTEDGVRFEEVSVGYPREWRAHGLVRGPWRQLLPAPRGTGPDPFTAWAAERSAPWART